MPYSEMNSNKKRQDNTGDVVESWTQMMNEREENYALLQKQETEKILNKKDKCE